MTFPSSTINTTNLDAATDDPSLARTDLYNAVTALNSIISEADIAGGVALLNGSGQYASAKMPTTLSVTGTQTISPTSGIVSIQDRLRLSQLPTASINALTGSQLGDIVISTDANAGNAAICFYDGTNWRYMGFGNLSVL